MAEKTRISVSRLADVLNDMSLKAEVTDSGSIMVHVEKMDGTVSFMSERFELRPEDLGTTDHEKIATLGVVVGADVMSALMTALRVIPHPDALEKLLQRAGELKRESEDN